MLRPHVILVDQVVLPCYSLGEIIRSPRVGLITLGYILWLFLFSLRFLLMPGMCH